jgi:predicted dehydrogenase
MDKVHIAVAGAGSIGVRHIEEIQRSHGAILSAIIDPSPKAIEVGRREDAPVYRSLPEFLAGHRPDGVVLATPNQMHVEEGLQCIAAGVPVLIEKPIAHTLEDGARLVQAAERANAKLLVGHHRRHSRILHKAVEIVQSGVLGRLVAVMGSAAFYKPDGYFDGPFAWRKEPGGGPILLNMIHEVDNLRAMVGENCRGSSDSVERDPQVSGGRYGGDQPSLREWGTGRFPIVRHGRLGQVLGTDVAGERSLPDLRR